MPETDYDQKSIQESIYLGKWPRNPSKASYVSMAFNP